MSRYIDADKLESELFRDGIAGIFLNYPRRVKFTIGEIRGMLKNERIAPTADVVKVRHGEWDYIATHDCFSCNLCKFDSDVAMKYCGGCGAKMDGERREE